MSVMTDIAALLEAAGAGSQATSIFVGRMPETPDQCVSVIPYQGMGSEYVQDQDAPAYGRPSVQVMVRGKGAIATEARAFAAYNALASVTNQIIGSTFYLAIRPNHEPFPLPRDGNDRDLWVVNAQIILRR